ncbi:hypothetical protein ABD87_22935 [Lysinibacillus sphaericus]|uniref:isopeptide-forming domain-containing fimbrial protein n=1 Tax=Lysinibacillus sphaericus TaxID=1421 RepID=UPI0018CE624F|nr:isopeptide-forming domain-containing fimbrial protein [Lysinibacillus sphaericus]MBG9732284.1 hypothetical protein [Lysinibacillus sphaericus]
MADFGLKFRKNAKKIIFIYSTILVLVISMMSPYLIDSAKGALVVQRFETIFGNKINVQQAPIVEVIKDNTVIPKDHEFVMKTTEKTSVKVFGNVKGAKTYQTNINAYPDKNSAVYPDNIVTAIPLEQNAVGSYGAIYENVGTYKGKPVNVRMTILGYDTWIADNNPYRPHVYINSKQMGINTGGADIKVRYEFLDGETGKVIQIKGIFSIADIDSYQGVEVFNSPTNVSKVFVTPTSPMKYSSTTNGFGIFSDQFEEGGDGINGEHPDHIATMLFDSSAIEFKYYQDRFMTDYQPPYRAMTEVTIGGQKYKPGDAVNRPIAEQWRAANPTANFEKFFIYDGYGYTDINNGGAYFEISANKPLRTEIAKPTKVVSDTDEFEVKENTISKKDELFTYTVEHFVPAEYSRFVYQSYEFADDLEDVLSVENVRITNELGMDVTNYFDVSIDAQSSKVIAKAKSAILKLDNNPITTFYNHSYFFAIDAKIKNGADLSPYYKNGIAHVPNKATVAVDGVPYVSNDVITKINPSIFADDVQIKKTVNGKLNYTLKDAKETFRYGISATIPPTVGSDGYTITDKLENVLSYLGNAKVILSKGSSVSGNLGNQLQLQGSNLSFTLTPQQLSQYAGGEITIEFDAQIRDGADLSAYKRNEIPTIPNSASIRWDGMTFDSNIVNVQVPIFEKKVNGKNHLDLTKKDQIFNYEISTVVPDNVTSFVVTDTLVNALKITDPSSFFVNMGAQVNVKDQTLTVTLDQKTISENVGKPLYISFTANVRENADLSPYIQQDYKVPNTATINIDGNNNKTNTVTVKPPLFEKKVDGKNHVTLGSNKDTFTYTVDATVPNGIKDLMILDELEPVLEVVSTKLINVTDNETIKDVATETNGNLVSVNMTETTKYVNKTIQLQIVAKIKDGADLSTYKNVIPNEAFLLLDKQRITSNEVTVKAPYVDKKVNGVDDYDLLTQDEIVDYTIKTTIPTTAESFTISDKLMQELEIVGKPTFSIEGITPSVNGNSVEVKMNKQQVQANANKDVVLTIKARIVKNADLSPYKDEKIPNKAIINTDGKILETPTVTIKPPTDIKLVNGKTQIELAQRDEKFTYTIETRIPKDKNSFDIVDTLVNELEIVGTPKTSLKTEIVDGQTVNPPVPTVNGQVVSLHMNKEQIDVYGDQKVILTIEAKIKNGADISTYANSRVPNKATILIDGKSKETNTVYVSPQLPVKTVDGKKHVTLEDKDQTFKYEVKYVIPQDAKKLVITDTLVKELEFIKEPQVNIKGVTAKVDGQNVTVTLNATQVEDNAGKELILSFESGIRHGADLSKYKDGNIPNVAKVNVDDNQTLETNTVTVSLPTLVKTINGTDFVRLTKDTDEFTYQLATKIPTNTKEFKLVDVVEDDIKVLGVDVNLRGYEAKVNGQKVTVEFTEADLAKLAGQDLKVVIKAQLKNDYNVAKYKDNKIPNVASIVTENGTVKSNTVNVTVDATKQPRKTVNGVTDLTLLDNREVFDYKVAVQIPEDAKSLTLVDDLVKDLELTEAPTTNLEGVIPTVDGQKVTVTLGETLIGKHGGKMLELHMKSQIRLNADLSIYQDGKVPNKAVVNVDGNKYETNTAYVSPQLPVKTVNGQQHINLEKFQQSFTYKIDVVVPQNATDFTLIDKLVEELEVLEAPKVNLDGVKASIEDQEVKVKLNEAEIKKYAGKKLSVSFLSGIKVGADLSRYTDGNIPNTAELLIDKKPVVKTNTVTVSLPQVVKYINGQTDTEKLENNTDEFTYTVETVIPNGAKKFVVQDVLKDDIQVVSAETNLRGIKANVNKQDVSVKLTEAQIKEFENKKIILTIKAKLKDDFNLNNYEDSKIPNTAVVIVDDNKEPMSSNTVFVTAPPNEKTISKTPISKTINGSTDVVLNKADETFKYEIKAPVPKSGKQFIVADELDKGLEFVGTGKVNLEGVDVKVKDQRIVVHLDEQLIKKYAGKDIILTFNAKLKANVKFTDYADGKIPNTALYQIDDKEVVKSNTVFVSVKDTVLTPSKEIPPTPPTEPTDPNNPSTSSKVLPQTGDAGFNYNMLFVGLALSSLATVIGFYLFRRYRKMEQGEL